MLEAMRRVLSRARASCVGPSLPIGAGYAAQGPEERSRPWGTQKPARTLMPRRAAPSRNRTYHQLREMIAAGQIRPGETPAGGGGGPRFRHQPVAGAPGAGAAARGWRGGAARGARLPGSRRRSLRHRGARSGGRVGAPAMGAACNQEVEQELFVAHPVRFGAAERTAPRRAFRRQPDGGRGTCWRGCTASASSPRIMPGTGSPNR